MEGTRIDLSIEDAISRLRFAPSSNNLLISSWDCKLRLYDLDRSLLRWEAMSEDILLDCCFGEENVVFSVGSGCDVKRYDLHGEHQDVIGHHDDLATCIDYSSETSLLITAGMDKKIMFWDMHAPNGHAIYSKILPTEVESMTLNTKQLMVATGSLVHVYDLRNLMGPLQEEKPLVDYLIKSIRSFSNSEAYAVGSIDGRVALRSFASSDKCDTGFAFRCHPKTVDGKCHLAAVNDIAIHPSCGTFITGDNEGYVIIWDGNSRKRLFEFPRYPSSVESLAYNHGGRLLAVALGNTYQEANELDEAPHIWIHETDGL